MPTKSGLPWLIIAQTIVTVALLGFAFLVKDATTQNLVVGAVIAHWLVESSNLGRQVADQRAVNAAIATDSDAPSPATNVVTFGASAPTPTYSGAIIDSHVSAGS